MLRLNRLSVTPFCIIILIYFYIYVKHVYVSLSNL
nr:MAG TPA: hypothetical protein [Inoviridae sp.]